MKKNCIIFDFDGTLVNTNDIIIETWKSTLRRFLGHELDEATILSTFGETLKDSVANLIPNSPYEEVRDHYRAYQDANCEGKVYVFDGVRALLQELRSRGCKIGVATSRTRNSFWKYMKDLELTDHVDEVVAMEDVTFHKPHPESIEKVLERFGAGPDDAIMIGDTKYDIGCAQNAGVDSVIVGWSHPIDVEALKKEGYVPDYHIHTPEELLEII